MRLLPLLLSIACFGQEHILSYDSDITVNTDSTMTVKETIKVFAAGQQIKHGIYRDFPTRYSDIYGNKYKVGFNVVEVYCDGAPEDYFTESLSNGVRVYVGKKNQFVSIGTHTYSISYVTNRQLGFFDDHDELYWNVTGNGWAFPIDSAKATVRLPKDIPVKSVRLDGFTGAYGSTAKNLTKNVEKSGLIVFATNTALGGREGLSIVISWPKGYIAEPTTGQRISYFIRDNIAEFIAAVGFLVVLAYYLIAWFLVGRDPPKGTIIPLYHPPDGFSPEEVRYIMEMGSDNRTFTSAVVNMAVKGRLVIEQAGETFLLRSKEIDEKSLNEVERAIALQIFSGGSPVKVEQNNWETFKAAKDSMSGLLEKSFKKRFFFTNTGYFVIGLLASVAFVIGSFTVFEEISVAFVFIITLITGLNILFCYLMKAPTVVGRKVMDKIEGFKLFLSVAEKTRMNVENPPEMTPKLFEKYLPYALALGVEQKWCERFSEFLAKAGSGGEYTPAWYYGPSWSSANFGGFTSSLGKSFSSAISSASTAPGSSSGDGGGGFSGGGGGGGGGGGW